MMDDDEGERSQSRHFPGTSQSCGPRSEHVGRRTSDESLSFYGLTTWICEVE
jgi:hypothetical protein